MKNNKVNYHLVLELLPGDFMPIDVNVLTKNNESYTSLEALDRFTKEYTYLELIEMIRNANIVPNIYLDGRLHIMNDNKYRYRVFTKDIDLSLDTFFREFISDKSIMNKFINIYIKYNGVEDPNLNTLKNAIYYENINMILTILFSLKYETIRNIYFYINDKIINDDMKRTLEKNTTFNE